MNEKHCEEILIQKWALLDGEEPTLSAEQIAAHLVGCENCRAAIGQTENVILLLEQQTRREQTADLWAALERRIETERTPRTIRQALILLGVFLVVYKLLEMVPEHDFGLILRIVPFILGAAVFAFLRENPFRINTELIMEK
jgi:predicted anti-sigma-YlaC factor YlaD